MKSSYILFIKKKKKKLHGNPRHSSLIIHHKINCDKNCEFFCIRNVAHNNNNNNNNIGCKFHLNVFDCLVY